MKKDTHENISEQSVNPLADFQQINVEGDIFKQMFRYSVIPTIIHDMEMNIINANDSALNELGYSRDELLKKSIFELHPEDELQHSEAVLNEMQSKEKMSVETYFKRKDGSVFAAEATPCKYLLGSKPVIHVFIQDITERKKAEKQLLAYNKQLNRRNKELEEFTYLTSHDLQEPLNSIISWISLLKNSNTELLDDVGKQSITMIDKSAYRMKDFIISLLDYTRVDRETEKTELRITNVIETLKDDLTDLIERNKATVKYTGNDISLVGYRLNLIKLFQNLVTNAIKYRKPEVDPVVEISGRELKDKYEFSVTDNGIGIDKEHYGKIFEIFRRLHTRDEFEGTGIGLAHCKKIVEQHDGDIWVQSEPGSGSTFYFTLTK